MNSGKLKCVYFNARSILNKLVDLKTLIIDNAPDLIVISETWLSEKDSDALLCFDSNYQVFRCDRSAIGKDRGGGVAVLAKKNLGVMAFELRQMPSGCELVCVDFLCDTNFRIVAVYRRPGCHVNENNEFLGEIEEWCTVQHPTLIIGDFNFPHILDGDGLPRSNSLFHSFLIQCSLFNLVSEATRQDNMLDLLLTNDVSLVADVKISENFSTSDHASICFEIQTSSNSIEPAVIRSPDFANCAWEKANDMIAAVDWCFYLSDSKTVDEMYEKFTDIIRNVVESCCPLKNCRMKTSNLPDYLQRLSAKKHFLWLDRFKPGGREAFDKCAKQYSEESRKFARNQEKRLICSGNHKLFFKYMNGKLNVRSGIGSLKDDVGSVVSNDREKAELFADFFKSVYKADNGVLPEFPTRCNVSLNAVDVSEESIVNAIGSLSDKTSETPDSMPSYFIKRTVKSLAVPLSIIFQRSISCSSLPYLWKTAFVVPLLKKPPAVSVKNYRPISLTSSVCKIFEIIIKKSILKHMLGKNLINPGQFGFLPGRSTLSQLISCVSDWVSSVNEKIQTEVVYIDYAKAFDVVCHSKLLLKLEKGYGITGSLLKWIRAFICGRTFKVKIGASFSECYEICSGVPQGSVLGPLLFLIYVNDVSDKLSSACKLFADDLKIYRPLHDPAVDFYSLQKDLDTFSDWSKTWQLVISEHKCKVMHINFHHECALTLDGFRLKPVEDGIRDLGVKLRPDLDPSTQCTEVFSKAFRVANCILRSLQHRCLDHYRKAFIVYCRPILEYCSQVWSPYETKDILLVEKVQKNFTRMAFRKVFVGPYSPDYSVRLQIFNLRSLEYRRIEFDLVLCYRIVRGFSDINFDDMFTYAPVRSRRYSHRYQLARKTCAVNSVLNCYQFRVIRIWNQLPSPIVEAGNVSTFKARLEKFDLHAIARLQF